jgi:hypothetical protein
MFVSYATVSFSVAISLNIDAHRSTTFHKWISLVSHSLHARKMKVNFFGDTGVVSDSVALCIVYLVKPQPGICMYLRLACRGHHIGILAMKSGSILWMTTSWTSHFFMPVTLPRRSRLAFPPVQDAHGFSADCTWQAAHFDRRPYCRLRAALLG